MKLKYVHTNIGVFYKNRSWAENWFKEVAKELGDNVTRMIINTDTLIIDTVDMHIVGMYPFKFCCGRRFDRIICEPDVWKDKNILDAIVRPTICNPIDVDLDDEIEIKEDKL